MDPQEPYKNAPPEVQKIVKRVLQLEKEWLHMDRPHIHDDVVAAVKEEVK